MVDWTTRTASATSRCDMPAFARPGPVRLQQATPQTGPYHRVADRRPGRRHQRRRRRSMGGRLNPPQVCSLDRGSNARIWPAGPSTAPAPRTPATSAVWGCICCAPRARTTPRVGVDRGQRRRTRCADRDPLHHNYSRVQHQGLCDDHRRQETFTAEPSRHPVPGSLTNSRSSLCCDG
jgi:hypothetical protein